MYRPECSVLSTQGPQIEKGLQIEASSIELIQQCRFHLRMGKSHPSKRSGFEKKQWRWIKYKKIYTSNSASSSETFRDESWTVHKLYINEGYVNFTINNLLLNKPNK
jgi:hypothetical protein